MWEIWRTKVFCSKVPHPIPFAIEVPFVFFLGAVVNDIFDSILLPEVDDLFHVLLGDCVEADDACEALVELEVFILRAVCVHNINRFVVRL